MVKFGKLRNFCFIVGLTLIFSGCTTLGRKAGSLAPKDTIVGECDDDENFLYTKKYFTAQGFDNKKTEYNYTANDVLESVYFEFDRSSLNGIEAEKAKKTSDLFAKDLALSALVVGNCDKFGKEQYNRKLGQRRAECVKNILIASGIDEARIATASLGSSKASKNICTKEEGATDRRCDIVVQKQK